METGTAVGWRLALVGVVALLLAAGFIGTACPLAPAPDYADSLAAARATFAADTARAWGEARRQALIADSAIQVSRTAKAGAVRWRVVRDTLVLPDTATTVPRPVYEAVVAEADSLWAAVRADSVAYAAQAERIRADSGAHAALASLRVTENRLHARDLAALKRNLAKARRSGPAHDTRFGAAATAIINQDAALVVGGPTLLDRRRVLFLEIESSVTIGPSVGIVKDKPTSGIGGTASARITF